MNFRFIKRGFVLTVLSTVMLVPTAEAHAAETAFTMPVQSREIKINKSTLLDIVSEVQSDINIEETIKIESSTEIAFRDMFRDKAFAVLAEEEEFLYVRAEADEESDWIGKINDNMLLEVVERDEEYVVISSGNLTGYVRIEDLIFGKDVSIKVREQLDEITLDEEVIAEQFEVAETREEEEDRLAAEEAKRLAEEKARKEAEERARRERRQSVVAYAKRFLGNPYVYGGTSLTNGTDCSGFVMRVYQNFGVDLPRTSYAMRSVGIAVSYKDMQPGDIVCYFGHVGIYAGNGQIVNAIDSAHGIGMTNVNYAPIITIRRMF